MEIQYKAEAVWLNSIDKNKIQGFFVPCRQLIELQKRLEDDEFGELDADQEEQFPCIIICGPNASFAE